MSYGVNEDSIRDGNPIELYKFVAASDEYLYTSQEDPIDEGLDTYEPIPMSRSDLQFEGEVSKSSLKVTMPRSEQVANRFIVQPPTIPMLLYVYRYHVSDGVTGKATIWTGRVIDAAWSGSTVTFNCESVYTSINRQGLQRKYGPNCPYTLYDAQCTVNELNYQLDATIDSMTGNQLTSTSFATQPDNYYTGGFLSFSSPPSPPDYRAVINHIGDTITIGYSIPGLGAGFAVKVYPGCAHNLADCFDKFNNGLQYGGFAWMGINPFNGTTLF